MFDKIRQLGELKKMRDQAMQMQKQLAQIIVEVETRGIKVRMSADQKILSITDSANNDLVDVKEALNEALKEVQKAASKEMQDMMGGLDGLRGLLGK